MMMKDLFIRVLDIWISATSGLWRKEPTGRAEAVLAVTSLFLAASCCNEPPAHEEPDEAKPVFDALTREICPTEQDPNPQVTGYLEDPELVETSGIVASWRTPGVLWLHNDSGHPDRIYATGVDGSALARVELTGISMADLEDIAAGPCPGESSPCLWLGDVGDNLRRRDDAAIYVLPEPKIDVTEREQRLEAERIWRFPVSFPGGPVDIEAIVLTPDGESLYMWEKVDEKQARIFRLSAPFTEDKATKVEVVGIMDSPGIDWVEYGLMITGADLHPSGRRLVLRLYTGIFEYELEGGMSPADLADAPMREVARPLNEPQGEAVAYDEAGTGIWTVSEDPDREPGQPLHHYPCPAPP